jgi:hypothetical protein
MPLTRVRKAKPTTKVRALQQAVGHSVTQLPDGRTLVIGGQGADGILATVSINDPRSGEMLPLAISLRHARAWHSATSLPNGKVLVLGGVGEKEQLVRNTEILDLALQVSEPLSAPGLTTARAYHTATLFTDGRVLIAGGSSTNGRMFDGAELWDVKSNSVKRAAGRLNFARRKQRAALQNDGGVLIEGGIDENGSDVNSAEVFDPEAGSFNLTGGASALAHDGAPYLSGSIPADGADDVAAARSRSRRDRSVRSGVNAQRAAARQHHHAGRWQVRAHGRHGSVSSERCCGRSSRDADRWSQRGQAEPDLRSL